MEVLTVKQLKDRVVARLLRSQQLRDNQNTTFKRKEDKTDENQQSSCNLACSISSSLSIYRELVNRQRENYDDNDECAFYLRKPGTYKLDQCMKMLSTADRKKLNYVNVVGQIVHENFIVWERVLEGERRRVREVSNTNHKEGMSEAEKGKLLSSVVLFAVRLVMRGVDPMKATATEILAQCN